MYAVTLVFLNCRPLQLEHVRTSTNGSDQLLGQAEEEEKDLLNVAVFV